MSDHVIVPHVYSTHILAIMSTQIADEKSRSPSVEENTAVQSQKAVSAYFTSEQILSFGFAEENSVVQSQTVVTDTLND